MANALAFTGTGYASIPDFEWRGFGQSFVGAIEFYIKTSKSNEVLFSYFQDTFPAEAVVLWIAHDGRLNVWKYDQGNAAFVNVVLNATVNDDCWHLISVYNTYNGTYVLDNGSQLQMVTAERSPILDLSAKPQWIILGADGLNRPPVAAAYSGLMSELRIWQGGHPDYILTPAFSVNVSVPLSIDTPNLARYWPFWTNQAAPLEDKIAKQRLVLNGQSIVSNAGQYYNDISEVICNGTMASFDPFTAGTTGAAFTYILQQSGLGGYTPATFRQLYLQPSYKFSFPIWHTDIGKVAYKETSQASFTHPDFEFVQNRLLTELHGVGYLWGFYDAACKNLQFIGSQYEPAAQAVYAALSADASYVTPQKSSTNLGAIINAVTKVISAVPEYGKATAGAITIAWTLIGFTQQHPGAHPDFTGSLIVESLLNDLAHSANEAVERLFRGVRTSVSVILGDWGLLDTVVQRVATGAGFVYGPSLDKTDNQDIKNLDNVRHAAIIVFSKLAMCAGFPMYSFSKNIRGGYNVPCKFEIRAPMFAQAKGFIQWPLYGGQMIIGYRVPHDTYITLGDNAQRLLQDTARQLGQEFDPQELYGWPFRQISL